VCASQPAAFQAVIADMGIAAERVLIFDDSAENVAGARMAVRVNTTAQVEQALPDAA